jgi:thiol:disulfide interchange protein DsbD
MKLRVIITFLVMAVLFMVLCETVLKETVSYEKALELSKEDDKLIMLKLGADDCKYCVKMDEEVFASHEVKQLLENFRVVDVNVDREKVPLGLEVILTPTFVFVDKEEKILAKLPGSWTKQDFIDLLNNRIQGG